MIVLFTIPLSGAGITGGLLGPEYQEEINRGNYVGSPLSTKFRIGCSPRVNVSGGGLMI